MEKHTNNNAASLQVFQKDSVEKIIAIANYPYALKICEKAFPEEKIEHFYLYPRTQEGIVAEVNHQTMVKIPHAKRGINGIQVEKQITDLIRHKTSLELPNIILHERPQPIAEYRKIAGSHFDKKWYARLTDDKKQALAQQLAEFLAAV